MSIITACFSPPSPITSNKGIIQLSFHRKVKKHKGPASNGHQSFCLSSPTYDRTHKVSGVMCGGTTSGFPRPLRATRRLFHFRCSLLPLLSQLPRFQFQTRFPSKWRERQKIAMLWSSVLAWQTLWGWLGNNVSISLHSHIKMCSLTVCILLLLQFCSSVAKSGRNHSWRQVLDGLRGKRSESVRHGSATGG